MSSSETNKPNGKTTVTLLLSGLGVISVLGGSLWALAIRPVQIKVEYQERELARHIELMRSIEARLERRFDEEIMQLDKRLQREMREILATRELAVGNLHHRIGHNESWLHTEGMELVKTVAALKALHEQGDD